MPRYKKNQYTTKEMYKWYKDMYKSKPVTYKLFIKIINLWGEKAVDALINGSSIRLYYGLSRIYIDKVIGKTYLDWPATKLAKKPVIKPNLHSSFYRGRLRWKRGYTRMNSKGTSFVATNYMRGRMAEAFLMPGGHAKFLQVAEHINKPEVAKSIYNLKVLKI